MGRIGSRFRINRKYFLGFSFKWQFACRHFIENNTGNKSVRGSGAHHGSAPATYAKRFPVRSLSRSVDRPSSGWVTPSNLCSTDTQQTTFAKPKSRISACSRAVTNRLVDIAMLIPAEWAANHRRFRWPASSVSIGRGPTRMRCLSVVPSGTPSMNDRSSCLSIS